MKRRQPRQKGDREWVRPSFLDRGEDIGVYYRSSISIIDNKNTGIRRQPFPPWRKSPCLSYKRPAGEDSSRPPRYSAATKLGWPAAADWFAGAWALGAVPLLLWALLAGVARLLGGKEGRITDLWRRLVLPLVVVSAGHLSKGLAKFVSWAPFLPRALREPNGLGTAKALVAKTMPAPAAFLGLSTVAIVCLGLVSVSMFCGIREHRLAHGRDRRYRWETLAVFALAAVFALIIAGWVTQS